MNNDKNGSSLYDLCCEFLEKSEFVVNLDMQNSRGGKLSLAFYGAVLETGMQLARITGAHERERLYKERLADKVAGFLSAGENAHHIVDVLPETIDPDLIAEAREKGLDNLAASMG